METPILEKLADVHFDFSCTMEELILGSYLQIALWGTPEEAQRGEESRHPSWRLEAVGDWDKIGTEATRSNKAPY